MPEQLTTFSQCLALVNIRLALGAKIQVELWRKRLLNSGINPLSTTTGLDTFELNRNYAVMPLKTMPESTAAALYDGIVLTQQDIDYSFDLIKNFTPSKTSKLIDKARVIELDAIVGSVKRSYQKQKLDVPQVREF